jgi:hypothetical protein
VPGSRFAAARLPDLEEEERLACAPGSSTKVIMR